MPFVNIRIVREGHRRRPPAQEGGDCRQGRERDQRSRGCRQGRHMGRLRGGRRTRLVCRDDQRGVAAQGREVSAWPRERLS
jgi:hypothetical protein